jgi:hypothetical protein
VPQHFIYRRNTPPELALVDKDTQSREKVTVYFLCATGILIARYAVEHCLRGECRDKLSNSGSEIWELGGLSPFKKMKSALTRISGKSYMP